MTRHVAEVRLQDRTARGRLLPRRDPYWRAIGEGRHVGYVKGARKGSWMARVRLDDKYLKERIGDVDDVHDADGKRTLSWDQAVEAATAWIKQQLEGTPKQEAAEPLATIPTVGEAVSSYVAMRDARQIARAGKSVKSDAHRLKRNVEGQPIAEVGLDALSEAQLFGWRSTLGYTPSGRQRVVNDFKAALNQAFLTYRKVLPADFHNTVKFGLRAPGDATEEHSGTGVRDNQIRTDEEVRLIVKTGFAIDDTGDLGRLVILLAATGARFSQIRRMLVRDVQPAHRRVLVPSSRKGKKRTASYARVQVGADVIAALQPVIADRPADAPLLEHWRHVQIKATTWERDYRGPWEAAAEMTRPWKKLIAESGLPETIIPYALRHSSIVRGIREGLPIRLVAALHDTSVVMIERHYARWITEGLDELAARAVVPMLEIAA